MERSFKSVIYWLFSPEGGPRNHALPRWIFLRGLGLIYFSAFYPLLFQIKRLIGPDGILPATEYLQALAKFGAKRFWFAPTLFWLASGSHMLMAVCWIGLVAAILLVLNVWPRFMLAVCFVCFLSFVGTAQDFSGYQSDGMLLEAGFISLFFAPVGIRPGFAYDRPPVRASLFLLQWEWFRIYFESGLVKLVSGEQQWRNFTAMDEYYQNGPLPTWVGWYVQHLPHGFHAFATGATLVLPGGGMADSSDSHRELHFPELPCSSPGCVAAGRSLPETLDAKLVAIANWGSSRTGCSAAYFGVDVRGGRWNRPTRKGLGGCAYRRDAELDLLCHDG
jgi:lipase maturation factor 1